MIARTTQTAWQKRKNKSKKPMRPCRGCGGQKPSGSRGMKLCPECRELRLPIWEQQREKERQERRRDKWRADNIAGKPSSNRRRALFPPDGQKWCNACQQYLPHAEFSANRLKKGGLSPYCTLCQKACYHRLLIKRHFGLTPDEYSQLSENQGGACAICGGHPKKMRLAVDHSHKTGAIRGLLCFRCNHRLLGAAHDSIELLRSAIAYLECPPGTALNLHVRDGSVKYAAIRRRKTTEASA